MASRVLPVVRLFFACDSAVQDLADEKWSLKNPWHTVQMPPGVTEKFGQEVIWLYAQLTGGVGDFNMTVELHDIDSGTRIGQPSQPEPWTFVGGQLAAVELVFRMDRVPFPRAGQYVFKLKANHADLDGGTSELRVLPGNCHVEQRTRIPRPVLDAEGNPRADRRGLFQVGRHV